MFKKISCAFFVVAVLASCVINPNQKKLVNLSCEQYKENITTSNDFSASVFEGGYANMEDPIPAMVQLMLIEQKGPGDYSRKINGAERFYQDNLIAAKRKECDTSHYPISPIHEFKKRTNDLVAERKKAGWTPSSKK